MGVSCDFYSLRTKSERNRAQARQRIKYAHGTQVRYVWAGETGHRGRPSYHLVIRLNKDAFYSVGKIAFDNDNMFHRLHEAWTSALRLPVDELYGLVEVPDNATYRLSHEPRYFIKSTDGDVFSPSSTGRAISIRPRPRYTVMAGMDSDVVGSSALNM